MILAMQKHTLTCNIEELSHSDNRVVISYPDLIPFDLYKGVLHVETEDFPSSIRSDRD